MNTAPKRYHCSSSQAFEDVPKTLRMMAFTAETSTATRIAQAAILPIRSVKASMVRLTPRSPDTASPLIRYCWRATPRMPAMSCANA